MKTSEIKKKFENFIYYYKWHTIVVIAVAVFVFFGVKMSLDTKEPDLEFFYVSDRLTAEDAAKNFEAELLKSNLLDDFNQDGEKTFVLDPLAITFDKNQDPSAAQKLQIRMLAGTQTLMLVHQYVLEDYDGVFKDIGNLAEDDDKTFVGEGGIVTGISVEGNKLLEKIGISTENLYLTIHQKKDGEMIEETKRAEKVLKYILEN